MGDGLSSYFFFLIFQFIYNQWSLSSMREMYVCVASKESVLFYLL